MSDPKEILTSVDELNRFCAGKKLLLVSVDVLPSSDRRSPIVMIFEYEGEGDKTYRVAIVPPNASVRSSSANSIVMNIAETAAVVRPGGLDAYFK